MDINLYIKLFMRLSPRYLMVTCLTHGGGFGEREGGELNAGGGGRWSKTSMRGEGPEVRAASLGSIEIEKESSYKWRVSSFFHLFT